MLMIIETFIYLGRGPVSVKDHLTFLENEEMNVIYVGLFTKFWLS